MFGTYWLAIGSTCPFINHTGTCLPVFNICSSRAMRNTRQCSEAAEMGRTPCTRQSETHGQQSILIVSWQQHIPVWLKLWCWRKCAGCDAQKGISSFTLCVFLHSCPLSTSFLMRCCALISTCLHAVKSNVLFVFLSSWTVWWFHCVEHYLFSESLRTICLLHGLQTSQIISCFFFLSCCSCLASS